MDLFFLIGIYSKILQIVFTFYIFAIIISLSANPTNASKSVNAIAISGLWLSSGYKCGFDKWSVEAYSLFGWIYIESGLIYILLYLINW